ncbi:YkgJ family cysteine cluster protein [Dehalobacter sp. DCM]|uniref:YkgJ family cysteine cluster protein n=1 Tax=Dehalobacter sp. DCM TaxID=2907827 RepID=UPI00308123EF|nr:YkgJ family cysteine cluster protein [Dehalobacter sp. DCM]
MKTIEQRHLELYEKIPKFECKEGCVGCCGPIPFTKWEWERIEDKRKATELNCPYAIKGRCNIYEKRPLICRLYGAVRKMKCPYGCQPESFLSKKAEKKIVEAYFKLMKEEKF